MGVWEEGSRFINVELVMMSCLVVAGLRNMEFNRSRCLQPVVGSRICGGEII